MAKIAWLAEAIEDKDDLLEYIAQQSVLAALAVDEQIAQQIAQLTQFPYLGRRGRVSGTFELRISRTPYIAVYKLDGNQVLILHLFHERRDWPLQ